MDIVFDKPKFKDLVQYVCWRCKDPTKLGATKLNKILWFVDREMYLRTGRPVTGSPYVKRQFGPVPKSINAAISELEGEKVLSTREVEYFGKLKREFFARSAPDLARFSPDEISLVDEIVDIVCGEHTAKSISEATHDRVWSLAEIGEEIPYFTVFADRPGELTEDDVAWITAEVGKTL